MNKYILSCCSTTDLTPEQFRARDIHYICFHFFLDGKEYLDDLGLSMPLEDFYDALANGATPATSQVSVGEFTAYFREFLKQGYDILHVSLSSGLSGCYNSACVARDSLKEEFPERKICVIDSLCGSGGAAILLQDAADLRDQGASLEEVQQWIEAQKLHVHHWLFTPDLSYFVRGGRVSAAAGWIGTLLKLCPLVEANQEGRLIPREKIRGKARAMQAIVEKMRSFARDGADYHNRCQISHANCPEDAHAVARMVEESFPHLRGKIAINHVGTTLGSHCGPGMVALFFYGTKRTM